MRDKGIRERGIEVERDRSEELSPYSYVYRIKK
jgi:hypothetical protein